LEKLCAGINRLADHINRVGSCVDDRRTGDTDFRGDIAEAAADERACSGRGYRSFTRSASVRGINQIDVPESRAGGGIAIKRVKALVLRSHNYEVMTTASNGLIRGPEWLGIDRAVGLASEKF